MNDFAAMLNTFLKLFLTDAAMVPFLFDVLERLLRRFLKLFVLKAVADAAVTPYQLIKTSGKLLPVDDKTFQIYNILLIF